MKQFTLNLDKKQQRPVVIITVPNDESNVRNLRFEDANGRLHVFCSSDEV